MEISSNNLMLLTEAANMTSHAQYLSKHPYHEVSPEEMAEAEKLLKDEAEVVKKAMQHGNITMDVYGKVWRDCYSQVDREIKYWKKWIFFNFFLAFG